MAASYRQPSFWAVLHPLLFAAAYVVAAEVGHSLSFPGDFASFWPPSGVYVAVLLAAPRRSWPHFCLAAVVGNLLSDVAFHHKSIAVGLGFAAGNTLEAVAGAWLVGRFTGRPFSLGTLHNVLVFCVCAALVSPALGASVGAATAVLAFGGSYGAVWATWWISGVIGVLVVGPLTVELIRSSQIPLRTIRTNRVAEALALLTLLGLAALFVFGHQSYPIAWLPVPLLLWAALRFEITGVALALGLMAICAVWHTARGHGPFAGLPVADQIVMTQAFISI